MTDSDREIESDLDREKTTDSDREIESNGLDRRTMLKGTAVAGLAGSSLTGTASATGFREITFKSVSDEVFDYFFEVSGRVKRGGTYESDSFDEVGRDFANGNVAEGRGDSFLFSGELETLRLKGPGKVFVEGDLIEDTTRPDLSNEITIEAEGPNVDYEFQVSGQVERGEFANTSDDILDSSVVRGSVGGGGKDSFRYSGAIAFKEADGPLTVTLDINPD